jgi:hypothetical protein
MLVKDLISSQAVDWLMDPTDPGARYLALRDVIGAAPDDPELATARQEAHLYGPISFVLSRMEPDGYWVRPRAGYNPKYTSTVWSIILLSQLGARAEIDSRLQLACAYMLDHTLTPSGQFSTSGAPSGTIDCLQGNLCAALLDLGVDDPRLDLAFEWMARTVTGEGLAPADNHSAEVRYYAYKCGPTFRCGVNGGLPCGWGAAKVMLAFGKLPQEKRTPLIEEAISQGVEFLFSVDPAEATYPTRDGRKPSANWWKFGFPVFYITDLLQVVEALCLLGYGEDPRLADSFALIESKRDEQGRWNLEYDYAGKTWVDFGKKKQPNKWVTMRALRTLGTQQ